MVVAYLCPSRLQMNENLWAQILTSALAVEYANLFVHWKTRTFLTPNFPESKYYRSICWLTCLCHADSVKMPHAFVHVPEKRWHSLKKQAWLLLTMTNVTYVAGALKAVSTAPYSWIKTKRRLWPVTCAMVILNVLNGVLNQLWVWWLKKKLRRKPEKSQLSI